ncbi:MAG TPA: capsule assembly Wzi family protein [Terracidiphilus sp.]|nr:capsule assembly Wzi family protein [Terracidiphilus sp.]
MNRNQPWFAAVFIPCVFGMALLMYAGTFRLVAEQPGAPDGAAQVSSAVEASPCEPAKLGSPYIPVDSWVYPAMLRLYSLGYVDHVFIGLRPWTRASVMHMLENAGYLIDAAEGQVDPAANEARAIYDALNHELHNDMEGPCGPYQGGTRIESVYSVMRGISGTPLDDSYHLGQTIVNDYGRPYENGFDNYSGVSGYATAGRFALYLRAEFQGAPSAAGYSAALAQTLTNVDGLLYYVPSSTAPYANTTAVYNQTTIPQGPIASATQGRFLEAYLSYQFLNHVISFGKQDQWLGPAQGGSMAFSNNAQNFYAFEINRIEPLHVPGLSMLTGPFRYEFLVGALRGHTFMPNTAYEAHPSPNSFNVINPGDPWVHMEKVSFKPYKDLEFGFERTAMFGGEGHEGVSLHSFLRSFFSFTAGNSTNKNGNTDPGARFGAFDFSWRLPFVSRWLMLYSDSFVHDDVSPMDAPRRAAMRPGLYLSHVPGLPKLDIRGEAATTSPRVNVGHYPGPISPQHGDFIYYESIEKQGYTNQGQIFGDWIGREDKGGQVWITYHLSGNEWLQVNSRRQKATTDFIPGGTTLNDIGFQAVKRIGKDFEINGNFAVEHYKAPIYLTGEQTVTTTNIQLTWYPQRKISF